ncbi:MAG: phytanoyl-CoA dioxygenase family protein [Candidatus Kapaibacterium sp.]
MQSILSDHQRDIYNADGLLAPLPVLSPDDVENYRRWFEEFERFVGGRVRGNQTKQLHLYASWAYDLALHPNILDVVEGILGPDILVHDTAFFCKYPEDTSFVSWHQDGYYMKLSGERFTTAWIALTDSTPENGCMRVITGSHGSVLPHIERPAANNMLGSGMTLAAEIDESRMRDVMLRAGEMSLHHVNLVHSSGENRAREKRVGFAIRYIAAEISQELPHHPVVVARGVDKHRHFEHLPERPAWPMAEMIERQREGHAEYLRARGFQSPVIS